MKEIPIKKDNIIGIIKLYEMMLFCDKLTDNQRKFYKDQITIHKNILRRSEKND